ncbi:MAG: hypothetical protein R2697_13185 [Ilumatobacteraceae bacterium]
MLSHLAELRSSLQERSSSSSTTSTPCSPTSPRFAGLWQESTVRGPAWRIGDTVGGSNGVWSLDLLQGVLDATLNDPT